MLSYERFLHIKSFLITSREFNCVTKATTHDLHFVKKSQLSLIPRSIKNTISFNN